MTHRSITSHRVRALVPIILMVVTAIVFGNALINGFVYDDSAYVVNNHHIRDLRLIPSYFTSLQSYQSTAAEGQFKVYRPLVTATFALDYAVWQLNPAGYHLTNIVLHCICGWLLFIFFLRLFSSPLIACFTAVVFLIHPIQVEAVTWISGRGNMLYTVFAVLSLHSFLSFIESSRRISYVLSLIWYIVALFSKEMAVAAVPLIGLVYIYKKRNNIPRATSVLNFIFLIVPYLLVTLAYMVLRYKVIGELGQRSIWGGSYLATFATMTKVVLIYFVKLIFPVELNILPRISVIESIASPDFIGYAAVLIISIYLCGLRKKTPAAIRFGFWWILIGLLPVLNLIPLRALFAERFLYLSVAGFGLLVSSIVFFIPFRRVTTSFLIAVVVLLAIRSIARNADWESNQTLWRSVLEVDPDNAKAYNGLAIEYFGRNQFDTAEQLFLHALQLDPENLYVANNLALLYIRNDQNDKALDLLERALQLEGKKSVAYHNAGLLYLEQQQYTIALRFFMHAIGLDPNYANAYNSMGMCYFYLNDMELAVESWLTAHSIRPGDPQPYYNIVVSYIKRRQFNEAQKYLQQAQSLYPDQQIFINLERSISLSPK